MPSPLSNSGKLSQQGARPSTWEQSDGLSLRKLVHPSGERNLTTDATNAGSTSKPQDGNLDTIFQRMVSTREKVSQTQGNAGTFQWGKYATRGGAKKHETHGNNAGAKRDNVHPSKTTTPPKETQKIEFMGMNFGGNKSPLSTRQQTHQSETTGAPVTQTNNTRDVAVVHAKKDHFEPFLLPTKSIHKSYFDAGISREKGEVLELAMGYFEYLDNEAKRDVDARRLLPIYGLGIAGLNTLTSDEFYGLISLSLTPSKDVKTSVISTDNLISKIAPSPDNLAEFLRGSESSMGPYRLTKEEATIINNIVLTLNRKGGSVKITPEIVQKHPHTYTLLLLLGKTIEWGKRDLTERNIGFRQFMPKIETLPSHKRLAFYYYLRTLQVQDTGKFEQIIRLLSE